MMEVLAAEASGLANGKLVLDWQPLQPDLSIYLSVRDLKAAA
jgi:hypothetical protein